MVFLALRVGLCASYLPQGGSCILYGSREWTVYISLILSRELILFLEMLTVFYILRELISSPRRLSHIPSRSQLLPRSTLIPVSLDFLFEVSPILRDLDYLWEALLPSMSWCYSQGVFDFWIFSSRFWFPPWAFHPQELILSLGHPFFKVLVPSEALSCPRGFDSLLEASSPSDLDSLLKAYVGPTHRHSLF